MQKRDVRAKHSGDHLLVFLKGYYPNASLLLPFQLLLHFFPASGMKPYQQVSIQDCGEPLIPIPADKFALEYPHPYEKLGADYGGQSPYYLRASVLAALLTAQAHLQQVYPGWQIKIFDAYRPIAVQQFMVDYTFNCLLQDKKLHRENLSLEQQQQCWEEVYQIWAIPSPNAATPPPHSTGAAVDITLVDGAGNEVDMGGEIDELSPRSQPDFYAQSTQPAEREYQARRQLLQEAMAAAGFRRHPGEWWHFSLGDQMWAWQEHQNNPNNNPSQPAIARYGLASFPLTFR